MTVFIIGTLVCGTNTMHTTWVQSSPVSGDEAHLSTGPTFLEMGENNVGKYCLSALL